jgi:hypothetical protein
VAACGRRGGAQVSRRGRLPCWSTSVTSWPRRPSTLAPTRPPNQPPTQPTTNPTNQPPIHPPQRPSQELRVTATLDLLFSELEAVMAARRSIQQQLAAVMMDAPGADLAGAGLGAGLGPAAGAKVEAGTGAGAAEAGAADASVRREELLDELRSNMVGGGRAVGWCVLRCGLRCAGVRSSTVCCARASERGLLKALLT